MPHSSATPPPLGPTGLPFTPRTSHVADWLYGGTDNYQPDRDTAIALLGLLPGALEAARVQQAFVRRAVMHLAGGGTRQFLDLGCGLSKARGFDTFEAAQDIAPDARIASVDNDPAVLAHGRCTLDDNEGTRVIDGDVLLPGAVRDKTGCFFDWSRPVAVILAGVLDCLPGPSGEGVDPAEAVAAILAVLPPDSHLVLCQTTTDDPAVRDWVSRLMRGAIGAGWGRMHSPDEITAAFGGLDVLGPGPGDVSQWRPARKDPSPPPPGTYCWGGVGRTSPAPGTTS